MLKGFSRINFKVACRFLSVMYLTTNIHSWVSWHWLRLMCSLTIMIDNWKYGSTRYNLFLETQRVTILRETQTKIEKISNWRPNVKFTQKNSCRNLSCSHRQDRMDATGEHSGSNLKNSYEKNTKCSLKIDCWKGICISAEPCNDYNQWVMAKAASKVKETT